MKGYIPLFLITFIVQAVYFKMITDNESISLLSMFGFSAAFVLLWSLLDKIMPLKKG